MEQIEQIYKSHGYPGADRLFAIAKSKGISVKLSEIKEFISSQTVAQLHKQPKTVAETPITVDGKDTEYQLDLLDLSNYAKSNQGNSWILILENVWDRRASAIPCKTKSPASVLPALQSAIKELGNQPVQIVSDSGTEWKGVVKTWLAEQGISHRTVEIGTHSSLGIIDSFAKFIKHSLGKYFTHSQQTRWLDYLPNLVGHYNDTPHSSLKAKGQPAMSPLEAERFETDTRNIHMAAKEKADGKIKPSGLSLHDHVRVLKRKQVFDRGYEIRYSKEIFTIEKIDGLWYTLSNGSSYREGSLQKVQAPKVDEQKEVEPIKDVSRAAKFDHKTESILKNKEGVSETNRRPGLRERKPESQLSHELFGKINW